MTWWDRPSGTCRPAPVGVGRRPARWCAGARDGRGRLHRGGSWSNPRVRARRSAPRLGGEGGPRRRFLRRTACRIMPVPRRRRRRGCAAQQISAVGPGAFSPPPTPCRVGRWEVDRMTARRTTESRGFVLKPRCLALVSRWDGKSVQVGEGEDAGRPGRRTWAHRCSAGRIPRRPVRHNDRLRSGLEESGR